MADIVITKDYAYGIYNGQLPGLFRLNHHGNYGDYIRYEVIYADLRNLFGFVIYQNPNDIDDYKFPYSEEGADVVDVEKYEIKMECNYKVSKV